jgi:hypothetical protein
MTEIGGKDSRRIDGLTLFWMSTDGMLVFLAGTINLDPKSMGVRMRFERGGYEGILSTTVIPLVIPGCWTHPTSWNNLLPKR